MTKATTNFYGEWGDDIVHGGAGYDFLSGGKNGTDTLAYTELDDWWDGGVVVNLRQEPVDISVWAGLAQMYASYSGRSIRWRHSFRPRVGRP